MKGRGVYTHGMKNKNYTERTLIKHSTEWNDRALAVAIHYGVGKSEAIRLGIDALYESINADHYTLSDLVRMQAEVIRHKANESKGE